MIDRLGVEIVKNHSDFRLLERARAGQPLPVRGGEPLPARHPAHPRLPHRARLLRSPPADGRLTRSTLRARMLVLCLDGHHELQCRAPPTDHRRMALLFFVMAMGLAVYAIRGFARRADGAGLDLHRPPAIPPRRRPPPRARGDRGVRGTDLCRGEAPTPVHHRDRAVLTELF